MELQRSLLWAALAVVLLLLWQDWQKEYGAPTPPASAPMDTVNAPAGANNLAPAAGQNETRPAGSPAPVLQTSTKGKDIHIKTDVLNLTINTAGADIRQALLNKYPVSVDKPDTPFQLMGEGTDLFIAQSGLLSSNKGVSLPGDKSLYQTGKSEYSLTEGQDQLQVVFTWHGANGLAVDKVYTLHRGNYLIDIQYRIHNGSAQDLGVFQYRQLLRADISHKKGLAHLPTYVGGVISGKDTQKDKEIRYEKIKFKEMAEQNLSQEMQGGWTAMLQHYFLTALVPAQDETNRFYTLADKDHNLYTIGMTSTLENISAGGNGQLSYQMFVGPKLPRVLEEVAPHLELSVDFGIMTIVADPLHWLLSHVHDLVGNWGWAIIIVTLIIRLAMFPLQSKSAYSMAQMRKLTPRLQQLKERYGDDKQKYNQAMMELWRKEKVNPFGGCLPIIIQMPFFLAFYWVILESVELRQADWILWYKDLSIADPFYVLPILMGLTSLIQMRLNPTSMDPMQQKMMMLMPVVFTALFIFFPSGLVLYYTVSNIFQLGQQIVINRKVGAMK